MILNSSKSGYRAELDPLGEILVPGDCLHGAQAERACRNFQLTGTPVSSMPALVVALAQVKKAAAVTNAAVGEVDGLRAGAIVRACDEIIGGLHHEHFCVDVCQGGAGTSTNMNANEVIANRAMQILATQLGSRVEVHPNDHVNRNQSTNDAYATAVRLTMVALTSTLIGAVGRLSSAFDEKAHEFRHIVKLGRTQLQDAVPMTLGAEFGAFAATLREDAARLREISRLFLEINLGGTAIGTGIAAHPDYRAHVCDTLAEIAGLAVGAAPNLIEATWDMGAFVLYSGMLKRLATKLSKISNDLRLLSSGPAGGLGEIRLPKRQPGSSIMPGKVNPVIPEAMNAIAFRVIGLDLTVTFAAEAGQLQLNAFEPVICWSLYEAATLLTRGMDMLRENCVLGIEADQERCRANLESSTALAAELVPVVGYSRAATVAVHAQRCGNLLEAVETLEPELTDYVAGLTSKTAELCK